VLVKLPRKIIPQLLMISLVLSLFSSPLISFRPFISLIAEIDGSLVSSLLPVGNDDIPMAFAEDAHDLKQKAEKKKDKADELNDEAKKMKRKAEKKKDKADELNDEAKKMKRKAEKAKAEEKEEKKQQEKDKAKEQKEKAKDEEKEEKKQREKDKAKEQKNTKKENEKQQKLKSIQTCRTAKYIESKNDECIRYYEKVCSETKNINGILGSDYSLCSNEKKKKLEETIKSTHALTELNRTLDESEIANKSLDSNLKLDKTDLPFECDPIEIFIVKGNTGSMSCAIQNNSPKAVEMELECSGFVVAEIKCMINKSTKTVAILIKEHSEISFTVDIVSKSSAPLGSYLFKINALCSGCTETERTY
jgi:outer membrane biosynthesis protein TonB